MPETDFFEYESDRQDAGAMFTVIVSRTFFFMWFIHTFWKGSRDVGFVTSRKRKSTFPNLGISVEVVKTQGKSVRLGIEAPREIRVIRAELSDFEKEDTVDGSDAISTDLSSCISNGAAPITNREPSSTAVRRQLDAANLAIHLAQNQLQQGLGGRAEEALDQVMLCLQNLERTLGCESKITDQDQCVRETAPFYDVQKQPIAVVCDDNGESELSERLKRAGYRVESIKVQSEIIDYVATNEPANVVITGVANVVENADCNIVVGGVHGLYKSLQPVSFGGKRLTGWFASVRDETRVHEYLES